MLRCLLVAFLAASMMTLLHVGSPVVARDRRLSAPRRRASPVLGGVLQRFPLPGSAPVSDLEWSPDGKTLAVAREDGRVELLPERRVVRKGGTEEYEHEVRVWWSADGRRLAMGGERLEVVMLRSGAKQVLGQDFISVAASADLVAGDDTQTHMGFACVKDSRPYANLTSLVLPFVRGAADDRTPLYPVLLDVRGFVTALSPDGRAILTRLPHAWGFGSHPDSALVVWRVRLSDGKILWKRMVAENVVEYYSYDRVVWSEEQQAAAVSCAGATDGSSCRGLSVVTRSRVLYYDRAPHLSTPPQLQSDPVWLGDRVVFAETGWDDFEAPNRKEIASISAFALPRGKHRILVSGADEYRAPAVSPDRRKLAYVEGRGRYTADGFRGCWTVLVRAVK